MPKAPAPRPDCRLNLITSATRHYGKTFCYRHPPGQCPFGVPSYPGPTIIDRALPFVLILVFAVIAITAIMSIASVTQAPPWCHSPLRTSLLNAVVRGC